MQQLGQACAQIVLKAAQHQFAPVDQRHLGAQGDERVSNSYNPRLRHAFFEYDAWLLGQTWSTFMILDIVEDLDFGGTAEGMVFVRQPQVRFTKGGFQAAIETSETTLTPWQAAGRQDSGNALSPDFVVRYNHGGDWGHVSASGLLRRLNHEFDDGTGTIENETATGIGLTVGGMVNFAERDDVRFQATAGCAYSGTGPMVCAMRPSSPAGSDASGRRSVKRRPPVRAASILISRPPPDVPPEIVARRPPAPATMSASVGTCNSGSSIRASIASKAMSSPVETTSPPEAAPSR